MGDMREYFDVHKEFNKLLRSKFGVPCPECQRLLPKAQPKILTPGARCSRLNHVYTDPRPELTQADIDKLVQP